MNCPKLKSYLLLTLFLLLRGSCSFLWNTITHNIYKQKTMHIYGVKIIENITLLQKLNQYINIKYTQSLHWIQITRLVLTEFNTSQCKLMSLLWLQNHSFSKEHKDCCHWRELCDMHRLTRQRTVNLLRPVLHRIVR